MKGNAKNLLFKIYQSMRKQTIKELIKKGALQNAILNCENLSSIATDEKGVIQLFNVGAERMLGYTASEVVNKLTPADISDPQEVIARANVLSTEFKTQIKPGFEALVYKTARGIEDIYELTNIRKNGSRFPAVVSITALCDANNRIIGYLLIGTDNTARKQAEAEQKQLDQLLREHQLYSRTLFDVNDDALIYTDPFGIIKDVNNRMETLTGYTRGDLLGAPFQKYFADQGRADAIIKLVLKEQKVANYELTIRARDGKEAILSTNATVLYDQEKKIQGMLAAARDVTDLKQLALSLQEKNQELDKARSAAERTSNAKSYFLANMSHELRTPLNAVIGFSEVLMDELYGQLNKKQQEYVKNIAESGTHLLSLINDILDLSKVESGKMELELTKVGVKTILMSALKLFKEKAAKHQITMSLDTAETNDAVVEVDERKLKQALYNLLSNAMKFTQDGGSVRVRARTISDLGLPIVDLKSEIINRKSTIHGDFIEISVADTGIGIKPGDMDKLFKPFSQIESGYTKAFEGTGLGLALTRSLVELHGGRIWAESEFGKGSTFTFVIPFNRVKANA